MDSQRQRKMHDLKLHPAFWEDVVVSGVKNFEVRLNDRDFQIGDYVRFWPLQHA